MEVEIDTTGVSAHGSQPERGRNAIYEIMPIIDGLKELHDGLEIDHDMLGRGSLAVTGISSQSPSLTAVPDGCTIHVDRRLTIGETAEDAQAQLEQVAEVAGENANVRLLHYDLPSWRGFTYPTDKVFPAWETALESPAIQSALSTAESVLGRKPRIHRSAFSSNGCATAGMFNIPTVGFGPADELHSHTVNDQIPLAQLQPAMAFYGMYPTVFLQNISG
jgi:putative selenium metabolism hydrolase